MKQECWNWCHEKKGENPLRQEKTTRSFILFQSINQTNRGLDVHELEFPD